MQRFLDYDPVTKRTRTFHSNAEGTDFAVQSHFDVTDIVEENKARRAMTDERARFGDMTLIGQIPIHILTDLQRQNILDPEGNVLDEKKWLRWFHDPANSAWRTRGGRFM